MRRKSSQHLSTIIPLLAALSAVGLFSLPGEAQESLTRSQLHAVNDQADQALANGRYDEAVALYRKVEDSLAENPAYGEKLLPVFYRIPQSRVAARRKELGDIQAVMVHRMACILIKKTDVSHPDDEGVMVSASAEIDASDREKVEVSLKLFKRYVEVMSEGMMTMDFSIVDLDAAVTRVSRQETEDYGGEELVYYRPVLESIVPYPGKLIREITAQFDATCVYWNHDDLVTRPFDGAHRWPLIPYQLEAPLRAHIVMPVSYTHGFTIFHEFFHSLEFLARVKPTHGFSPGVREHFPDWQGEGQFDYFQWHFATSIRSLGFEQMNYLRRFPHEVSAALFRRHERLAARVRAAEKSRALGFAREGFRLMEAGDTAAAMERFRESDALYPYQVRVITELARCRIFDDRHDAEAREYANRLVDLDPHDANAWYLRAIAQSRAGRIGASIADCGRALALEATCINAWKYRASQHFKRREFDRATADYREAISLDPSQERKIISFYQDLKERGNSDADRMLEALR